MEREPGGRSAPDSGPESTAADPIGDNPWLRPGFLASCCVVAVILSLGFYVGVSKIAAGREGATVQASAASKAPPAGSRAGRNTGCALPDPVPDSPTDSPVTIDRRQTAWRYSNAMAYPVSPVYGPGRTSDQGFRYCFQHSAVGALFAAANSMAFDDVDAAQALAYSEYLLAEGPYRQQQLAEDYVPHDPDIRLQIIGYRILSYTGDEALVDIAARASTAQETMIISCVMDLVWQRGDWRLSTDRPDPTNVVRIGDTTGYSQWSAD
jgi:hypothetical protein